MIPSRAEAEIVCDEPDRARQAAAKMEEELKQEYEVRDPGLRVQVTVGQTGARMADSPQATAHFLNLLTALPTGVQAMNPSVPGMVETSLNLGVISSDDSTITIQYSIRSSLESAKNALTDRVMAIFCSGGCEGKGRQ